VFQAIVSAEAKRYRFFFDSYPVTEHPEYHTENVFLMFPEDGEA
jgi:hypothetical protein